MEKIGFFATEIPQELKFLGQKISFPDVYFYYGAAQAAFAPEIEKCIKNMKDDFGNYINSFDDFLANAPMWIKNKLSPLIQFAVEQLSLNGCYDMTADRFFETYFDEAFEYTGALFQQMQKKQASMDAEQQARNAQRVAQRKLNEAEGSNWIVERGLNGLKWTGDQIKTQMQKDDFYDSTVKAKIKDEFEEHAHLVFYFFMDALEEHTGFDLSVFSDDDINKASAMFKNLKNGNIPESRAVDVALEILKLYPFVPGFLDWVVIQYGDADGEIQKLANALSLYVDDTKEYLLEQIVKNADFSTEEATFAALAKLEDEERKLNFFHQECHDKIDDILLDFDKKARTVDGIEYETREDANKAKELFALFQQLDLSSEEKIIHSRDIFLAAEKKLGFFQKKYEDQFEQLLLQKDKEARSFDGTIYETREEAKEAQRQYREMVKIIYDNGIDSLENTQNIINAMDAAKFTIPQFGAVRERLIVHLEILKQLPIKHIDFLRMLMSVPGKIITIVVLQIIGGVTVNSSELGGFFIILYFAFLISLFFTTRNKLLQRMNSFIRGKNYRMAALCYELTQPTLENYLNIKKDL